MLGGGREVPGLRPHLVARLRPGWEHSTGRFVSGEGKEIDPSELLPPGSRVEPMVPEVVEEGPRSEAEADLARYIHLVLPPGTDPDAWLDDLRAAECFEEVRKPPEISLPSTGR